MIVLKRITKEYHGTRVLNQISLRTEKSGIHGLLGPNGAGKTTLLKIMAGSIYPTEGEATINGYNVFTQSTELKKQTGYLPENSPVDKKLSIKDYLFFVASLKGLRGHARKEEIEKVVENCELTEEFHSRIGFLSKGFRQRVGFAQALINNPGVLFLDEPFNGMDPEQLVLMKKLLLALGKKTLILLSSHILRDIESLCTRVFIFNRGNLVSDSLISNDISLESLYLEGMGKKSTK